VQRAAIAPTGTDRRLALVLFKFLLRQPRLLRRRLNLENIVAWRKHRKIIMVCNICGHRGRLLYDMPDLYALREHRIGALREALRCRGCYSKMRDRTLAALLLETVSSTYGGTASTIVELANQWPESLCVLDTDAYGHLADRLRHCDGYVVSLFEQSLENGESTVDGAINVDLERMPFPDSNFDVILTSEVMEHVRYVETAHGEIARCLNRGGKYLFTVPYDDSLASTWKLIDPETDEYLVHPPHIHGDDPRLRSGGIKSYRVYGRDIVDDLQACGLDARFVSMDLPEAGIFGGDAFVAARR
jgi:SAM-dependent methyltransferase